MGDNCSHASSEPDRLEADNLTGGNATRVVSDRSVDDILDTLEAESTAADQSLTATTASVSAETDGEVPTDDKTNNEKPTDDAIEKEAAPSEWPEADTQPGAPTEGTEHAAPANLPEERDVDTNSEPDETHETTTDVDEPATLFDPVKRLFGR